MSGPPSTEAELFARAGALAGQTLATVAATHEQAVPEDLRRAKGWVGRLIEIALGATGGPAARHDFPDLQIELKTIPVDESGRPRESTFVCTAPLGPELLRPWEESWVCAKLSRVLWVPVIGSGPPGERRVRDPVAWSPNPAETAELSEDWEMLTDLLGQGHFDDVDGRMGVALQVRPKAADSADRSWAMNADAEWVQVNPRGFYLRASFTGRILTRS